MRILHINDDYAMTGGVARYLFEIMPLLERYGHENVVIYQHRHAHTVTDAHVTFYVPPSCPGDMTSYTTTQHILAEQKPDVVFLHAAYDPIVNSAATKTAPSVAFVHATHTLCPGMAKYFRRNDEICTKPFGIECALRMYLLRCSDARNPITVYRLLQTTAAQKKIYQSVSRLIVASQYMQEFVSSNGIDAGKISVLPCPLAPTAFHKPIIDEPLRILYAGRLEIEKGMPYLLRAFSKLTVPCELRIAGEGTLQNKYEALAVQLGIASNVRFLGWLDDEELDAEYSTARMLVMPSICPEAFGQVGIQALSHGRPVVAFNVGGIPDWLKDGEHGFLVVSRDIAALASRMDILLRDKALAAKMGAQGREFVLRAYDPQYHVTRLVEVFEQATRSRE